MLRRNRRSNTSAVERKQKHRAPRPENLNLPPNVQVCQRKTKLRTLYLQLTCDKEQ